MHGLKTSSTSRCVATSTACICLALGVAACSSNPPLMFADNVTFGLQVGNATTAAGGSVSLGYKHQSAAIVPVSALDRDGKAQELKSTDVGPAGAARRKDALSVFAVFETSKAEATPFRVGQTFATGLAAQHITQGYACKLSGDKACTALDAASAPVGQAAVASAPPKAEPGSADNTYQYQHPLVYARSDVVGMDIAGSPAEQGAAFTFGFGTRNVALVPVIAKDADGKVSHLGGSDGTKPAQDRDAFAVLGQFASTTELKGLGFCLERYFATGMAAQNLGRGLARAAANAASAAPQPEAQAKANCM